MTREDIERMESGREMDDLIAVNVMGWEIGDRGAHYISQDGKERHYIIAGEFQPSTDIAAAWQVVEKMRGKYHFTMSDDTNFEIGTHWLAHFYNNRVTSFSSSDSFSSRSASAPLAICRAALLSAMDVLP